MAAILSSLTMRERFSKVECFSTPDEDGFFSFSPENTIGSDFVLFFSQPLIFSLTTETDKKTTRASALAQELRNFQNFNSCMIKWTKTPISQNCHEPNVDFCRPL
jgi:hypothetical protein